MVTRLRTAAILSCLWLIAASAPLEARPEPPQLEVWLFQTRGKEALLRSLTETFTKKTGIGVELRSLPLREHLQRVDLAGRTRATRPDVIELPSRFFRFYIRRGWIDDITPNAQPGTEDLLLSNFRRSSIGPLLERPLLHEISLQRSNSLFATCLDHKEGIGYRIFGVPLLFRGQPLVINARLLKEINQRVPEGIVLHELLFETWDGLRRSLAAIQLKLVRFHLRELEAKGIKHDLVFAKEEDLEVPEKIHRCNNLLVSNGLQPISVLGIPTYFEREDDPFWLFPIAYNHGSELMLDRGRDAPSESDNRRNLTQSLHNIGTILKHTLAYQRGLGGALVPLLDRFRNGRILALLPQDLEIFHRTCWQDGYFVALPPRGLGSDLILRNYLYLNGSNFAVSASTERRDAAVRFLGFLAAQELEEQTLLSTLGMLPGSALLHTPWQHSNGSKEFLDVVERNGRYFGHHEVWPSTEVRFESELIQVLREIVDLDLSSTELEGFVHTIFKKLSTGG